MKPASTFFGGAATVGLLVLGALLRPGSVRAQDPCLSGMERSVDTFGQCCWPGQVWNGDKCVGPPTSCPSGFEVAPNGCEERFTECPAGQVVMPDQAHCCWPGQRWEAEACVGQAASCPDTHTLVGEVCLPVPGCLDGRELTVDRLHCCWPGQGWSQSQERCLGVPERCPQGLLPDGQDCVAGGPMVDVPAGPFWMGCGLASDPACKDDEKPGREVTLPAFRIEKTEVTADRYDECVSAGVCQAPDTGWQRSWNWGRPGRGVHPVRGVSWTDAATYCGWLGRRLPTEAEWEKAARGTDVRMYPWGNEPPTCARASMSSGASSDKADWGCGTGTTVAVGSAPSGASPYGALDMAGSVWEWTADWYAADAYSTEPAESPDGPSSGTQRVVRGGSFIDHAGDLRTGNRPTAEPSQRLVHLGFRCAR